MVRRWLAIGLLAAACSKSARTGSGPRPTPDKPLPAVIDAEAPYPTDAYHVIKLGEAEAAIVPKQMAADFPIWLEGGAKVAEYFTPTVSDVTRAERLLEPFLAGQPAQRNPEPLAKRFHAYKRDWVGFMTGGKRKLFASFFCETFEHDWTHSPIFVKDGGDCFFTVIFDLGSGQFEGFAANGEG